MTSDRNPASIRAVCQSSKLGSWAGKTTLGAAAWALTLLSTERAFAESMDFALERLAENSDTCRTSEGYSSGIETCRPDEDAFVNLVNQYGMAFAPSAMYTGRTTGYGGFEIALEGTYTSVDGDAEYMKNGTRGEVDGVSGEAAEQNESPASLLQLYSLRVRKGFGFGLETGVQFGFMPKTSMISGGIDLRLSILEGFREGLPRYLPDVAVTGSARTITGTAQVQLTVASAAAVMSKPFTIAGTSVLTPWFGYQHLFIYGDSGIIDFTPAENALQACGYQGSAQPGTPNQGTEPVYDGGPVCSPGGSIDDFNNSVVFTPVRLQRQRLLFGLSHRYEVLSIGGQLMVDVFDQRKLNSDEAAALEGAPSNLAGSIQVGAIF